MKDFNLKNFLIKKNTPLPFALNRVFSSFPLFFILLFALGCGSANNDNTNPEPEKITVSFNTQGGNTIPEQTISKGEKLTNKPTDPTKSNFRFDGWYLQTTGGNKINLDTYIFNATTTIFAQWIQLQTFTITFHPNKPESATNDPENIPTEPMNVIEELTATAPTPAPTLTNYDFVGWFAGTTTAETLTIADTAFDFTTTINENKNLYAKWTKTQITLTYHENKPNGVTDNVSNLPSPVTVNSGDTTTEPTNQPTLTGYNFTGWYTQPATTSAFNFSTPITVPKDLYAKWSQNPVLTFDTQGGSTITPQILTNTNTATKPQNPNRQDYDFVNWYSQATDGNVITFPLTVSTSRTIYARWTRTQRMVTFHGHKPEGAPTAVTIAGLTPDPKTVNVNSGDTVTEPTPPPTLAGFRLQAWHTGTLTSGVVTLSDNAFEFSTPIRGQDINLYTKWEFEPVAITFNLNYDNAPTIEPLLTNTLNGKVATTPTIPTARTETHSLNGWYTTTSGGDKIDFEAKKFTATQTVYAQWTLVYIVTFNYNYPTSTDKNIRVNTGEMITIENANPLPNRSPHYTLTEWHTTKIPSTDTLFNFQNTPINGAITLYAKWTRAIYTVTFNHNYGATPPTTTGMSNQLGLVAKPADPTRTDSSTHKLLNWYSQQNPTDTDSPFVFSTLITESMTLYVKWTNKIRVIFDTKGGTDIPTQALDSGGTPTKPDNPLRKHYVFINWYNMATGGSVYNFNTSITAETTIFARWKFKPETKDALIAEVNRAMTADGDTVDLNYIDTSLITDMSDVFKGKKSFNGNINNWNVSNVQNMSNMFDNAWAFNGNISNWNVATVQNMSAMFGFASEFNGNISNWNVANVQNMAQMFWFASVFNQDLNNWNVANVQNMNSMFASASDFNGNISNWNVATVQDMKNMFNGATKFNQDLNNWNVDNVQDMNNMFAEASKFNQDLNNWNVATVQNMYYMFASASEFNGNISNWNVANVQNMYYMFSGATKFNQDLNNWNVTSVQNMNYMFSDATAFNGNISSWNVAAVQNMNYMFSYASKFNQDLNNWNVSAVTNMSNMFNGASAFTQNIDSWNVATTVTKTDAFVNSGLANSKPSWAN